jgi:hypothetical protein
VAIFEFFRFPRLGGGETDNQYAFRLVHDNSTSKRARRIAEVRQLSPDDRPQRGQKIDLA